MSVEYLMYPLSPSANCLPAWSSPQGLSNWDRKLLSDVYISESWSAMECSGLTAAVYCSGTTWKPLPAEPSPVAVGATGVSGRVGTTVPIRCAAAARVAGSMVSDLAVRRYSSAMALPHLLRVPYCCRPSARGRVSAVVHHRCWDPVPCPAGAGAGAGAPALSRAPLAAIRDSAVRRNGLGTV